MVQSLSGVWGAFGAPYWPANLGGLVYRPLPIASYAIDTQLHWSPCFHAVNMVLHAGVAVAVTMLARRWASATAAMAAGLIFAVHPVHVEVVASIVGRADLMATLGTCLAVYAAVVSDNVVWSAAFLAFGILSKESAAATPALIGLAWIVGLARPPRRRMIAYGASWVVIGVLYVLLRWIVLRPYEGFPNLAPQVVGLSPLAIRYTAVAALDRLPRQRLAIALVVLVTAGAIRSALRVPVWRDNRTAALAMIRDAPLSYRSWDYLGWEYVWARRDERALESFRRAGSIYPGDARMHLAAAHMAYVSGRIALADSLLARADSVCPRCPTAYRNQASAAQLRGDTAAARFLLGHVQPLPR